MLRNADGGGGCQLTWKKCYEDVRFNVISVTRGWVGLKFPGKKHYVAHFNGLCKVKKIPENPNKLGYISQNKFCAKKIEKN